MQVPWVTSRWYEVAPVTVLQLPRDLVAGTVLKLQPFGVGLLADIPGPIGAGPAARAPRRRDHARGRRQGGRGPDLDQVGTHLCGPAVRPAAIRVLTTGDGLPRRRRRDPGGFIDVMADKPATS